MVRGAGQRDGAGAAASLGAQGWTVLDWARGWVAHPFFDVHLLPQDVPDRDVVTRIWDAYLQMWREVASASSLREAMRASKPLWAAQYAMAAAADREGYEPEDRSLLA